MPTINNWTEYEAIEGQIQLKDAYYNYVRLKMTRDTMYFVCLPNTTKTRLVNANIINAKEITDVPLSKKGHECHPKKLISLVNIIYKLFIIQYSAFGIFLKHNSNAVSVKLDNPYIDSPGQTTQFHLLKLLFKLYLRCLIFIRSCNFNLFIAKLVLSRCAFHYAIRYRLYLIARF